MSSRELFSKRVLRMMIKNMTYKINYLKITI